MCGRGKSLWRMTPHPSFETRGCWNDYFWWVCASKAIPSAGGCIGIFDKLHTDLRVVLVTLNHGFDDFMEFGVISVIHSMTHLLSLELKLKLRQSELKIEKWEFSQYSSQFPANSILRKNCHFLRDFEIWAVDLKGKRTNTDNEIDWILRFPKFENFFDESEFGDSKIPIGVLRNKRDKFERKPLDMTVYFSTKLWCLNSNFYCWLCDFLWILTFAGPSQ